MKRLLIILAAAVAIEANAAKVVSVGARSVTRAEADVSGVISRCEVKEGAEYDPAACARDVKALRDTGEYENITVEAKHTSDGIAIVYAVEPKPRYQGPLNVSGNEYFNAGKIAKLADLKDGYAYGDADFAAAANRVRAEYRKKHFADAKVTFVTEKVENAPDTVSVTMTIDEGSRCKIQAYEFSGNANADAADLRATFGWYPWWNPMGWFNDDPITKQDLAEARDKVAEYYRNMGYLDVKVADAVKRPHEDGETADVLFEIEEGTRYSVGNIRITGLTKYPEDSALAAVTAVRPGSIAGQEALDAAAHEIEVFCGSGTTPLADTHVAVKRSLSNDGSDKLDITFAVEEGVPVTIDRVLIRGNDYTKDKVIRREISLSPGDPMMADKAERSKRRLENLHYFDRVRYYLEKTEGGEAAKEGEAERRDLVYEVSEKSTGQFMVGIGASSVDSVYGTIELSESNFDLFRPWRFRGGGQKGRILLQAGPRYQTYEVSVTEPQLFDRLLELTVTAYRRQRWYDEYDIIRSGASASLSYPVKFWPTAKNMGRVGFRISAEYIEFDDVDNGVWYHEDDNDGSDERRLFREEEDKYGDAVEVPLRLFWEDDTRNTFRFASRGHRATIYGDIVGGDNEYWKAGFNFRQYLTVWKRYNHVFAFGVRGETVDAFSGNLPIYDRLFLGGPRSIRGVEYRDVAPRVYKQPGKKGSHAAWGGQTSWLINGEYSVPVVKFLRLAAFTDLGCVGEDEFDFATDWFCWSVGLGLRLDIEAFPIRLDFAVPVVEPDDDVDTECFSFTIGYDF